MSDKWLETPRLDPVAAFRHATTNTKEPGVPPHWVRCEWMLGLKRCRKGDGHTDEHEWDKPAPKV